MSTPPRNVIVRAPVTMLIGPIPDNIVSADGITSFGLGHMSKIFADKGIKANIEGQQAITTFSINGEPAESQTFAGKKLDVRVFRIQPTEDKHGLELSYDLGKTFELAAEFINYDFARAVGEAWVEGRVENFTK